VTDGLQFGLMAGDLGRQPTSPAPASRGIPPEPSAADAAIPFAYQLGSCCSSLEGAPPSSSDVTIDIPPMM
jgi:hypothetical protein